MGESHQELLFSLKNVVEGLLNSQVPYVWNIYGGLRRLHCILERIFKHECNVFKQNGEEDCWLFIQGLNWLRPSLATSPTPVAPDSANNVDKASIWLYNSLETHSLSEKLSWLLSDEQHLASCYNPRAFLRQPEYAEATLICLRAIEQNQLSLLSEIHPGLFLSRQSLRPSEKSHRRCSSFPVNALWGPKGPHKAEPAASSQTAIPTILQEKEESPPVKLITKDKPWKSMPCIRISCLKPGDEEDSYQPGSTPLTRKCLCRTEPSSPSSPAKLASTKLSPSVLKIEYMNTPLSENKSGPSRKSHRRPSKCRIKFENKLSRSETSSENGSLEEPHRFLKEDSHMNICRNSSVRIVRASLTENNKNSLQPMSTGFFPKPTEGESLTSFLTSSQFARSNAELDRENAHFSISEAIISAIEQVKCNRLEHITEEALEESDDEIKALKQRIRLRRKQKQEEKQKSAWYMVINNRKNDTTTSDQSTSPLSSSVCSSSESLSSEEGVADVEFDKVTEENLKDLSKTGLSLSMASLYSEADLNQRPPQENNNEYISSAEGVALSLLRRFSDKQLPRASDIQWLVSEKEVPQQLLPLPSSWAISPDDAEDQDLKEATPLRGTTQWAPPRPQIIFTLHPPQQRRIVMLKQQLRCAGCGMKVAPEYAHRFRYCEYLGRYFCTGCHSNSLAVIPARILFKWDFNKYPVSDFSYKLLELISSDPLFSIGDLNPGLYQKVSILDRVRQLRLQLYYLKEFVFTCRFATQLQEELQKEHGHILTELEIYSITDLLQVRSNELFKRLKRLVVDAQKHVAECQLCSARGFMCEHCRSSDVLFPWQLTKVSRCSNCGSCFHLKCHKIKSSCPRCDRILARNAISPT